MAIEHGRIVVEPPEDRERAGCVDGRGAGEGVADIRVKAGLAGEIRFGPENRGACPTMTARKRLALNQPLGLVEKQP
jgi:hypothetical protein